MFIACWSAKGGAGTTVVAAGLGLLLSNTAQIPLEPRRRRGRALDEQTDRSEHIGPFAADRGDALLVDLAGDLPAVLGLPEPVGPGITEWLAAGSDVPPDGLARIEVAVAPGLSVVPRGSGPLRAPDRAEVLAGLLGADGRHVIVDCGCLDAALTANDDSPVSDEAVEVVRVMVTSASQSLLVTRSCYLALRRYLRLPVRPSGVILLVEPGRSLTPLDVEEVCDAPVVAEIRVDAAVARAVDSGLLSQRMPRGLAHSLLRVA